MLVVGRPFAAHAGWLLATLLLAAGAAGWYAAEAAGADRLPGGGSRVGFWLGVGGAGLIGFEMLLWPRKRLARVRTLPLGRTKHWMAAHIWLGLLCVPVAVLHTGFRLGGTLTTGLMAVFAAVIGSGIWGLVMQNLIPRRMRELVPDEVPAAEIGRVMAAHAAGFRAALDIDRGKLGGAEVPGADVVAAFYDAEAGPYLVGGARPAGLRTAPAAARTFALLAAAVPAPSRPRVDDLRELCDLRRQLDTQARLHAWLHDWVWVHLPLSVALVGLLVAHIYTALRYL